MEQGAEAHSVELQVQSIGLLSENGEDLKVLRGFADFWKIPYSLELSDPESTVFFAGFPKTVGENSVIVCPSGLEMSKKLAEAYGLRVSEKNVLIHFPSFNGTKVSIQASTFEFSGPNLEPVIEAEEVAVLSRVDGTGLHLLSLDLLSEYRAQLDARLDERPSKRFSVASRLPLSYAAIPSGLRKLAFKSKFDVDEAMERCGPVDCLRTIFLASIVKASKYPVARIGFWKRGKTYAASVTHDIETKFGLDTGVQHLMDVEKRFGVRSTWNVPSNRYNLSASSLKVLTENGEVGAHDTKHDGRLVLLNSEKQVKRLKEAKNSLEKLTDGKVLGFRSPLLQHSRELLTAIGKAGFEFDSSVPSWEMLSPTSLRPHGVGTVFPFMLDGIVEIPVTLPQDHQLVRVAGLSPSEATVQILRLSQWIRGIGGVCVLLVHPEYEFAQSEHKSKYEEIISSFAEDPQCQVMTLGELSKWWSFRNECHIRTADRLSEIRCNSGYDASNLELHLMTDYSREGFVEQQVS